jgi:hypothetical protein
VVTKANKDGTIDNGILSSKEKAELKNAFDARKLLGEEMVEFEDLKQVDASQIEQVHKDLLKQSIKDNYETLLTGGSKKIGTKSKASTFKQKLFSGLDSMKTGMKKLAMGDDVAKYDQANKQIKKVKEMKDGLPAVTNKDGTIDMNLLNSQEKANLKSSFEARKTIGEETGEFENIKKIDASEVEKAHKEMLSQSRGEKYNALFTGGGKTRAAVKGAIGLSTGAAIWGTTLYIGYKALTIDDNQNS